MKRMMCMLMASAVLLCGCQSAGLTSGETQAQTEEITENSTEATVEFTEIETPGVTLPIVEQETAGSTALGDTGCVRVSYNGNVSSVRYITSLEDLPDNEALAGYDEAYFKTKALVVVLESVSSGSVKVGIESIENGVVTLSHELPGDAGTADMATWLLWAEVDAGLDFDWSVANPALKSNASTY